MQFCSGWADSSGKHDEQNQTSKCQQALLSNSFYAPDPSSLAALTSKEISPWNTNLLLQN